MELPSWTEALRSISDRLVELLPNLVGALGLLLLGWLLAIVARRAGRGLVVATLGRLSRSVRFDRGPVQSRVQETAPRVIGAFLYWVVFLFFFTAAVERFQLPVVTELLQSLAFYLPKVLLAVVIVFIGFGAGSLVNQWLTGAAGAARIEYAGALGRLAQTGVLLVAFTIAAQQVGIESGFFSAIVSIVVGVTLGGMALAFGLGSGPIVSNILASYYAAKTYRVGDRVRLAGLEGTVIEISPTSIVLRTAAGRAHLPARMFCDDVSVVVEEGQ